MDDMSTFERQLADEVRRGYGPPRAVDAMAIVRNVTTARPVGRWSVITRRLEGVAQPAQVGERLPVVAAVRFIAAASVAALFGGLLLVSTTARPPDQGPMPGAAASAPEDAVVVTSVNACAWTEYWPSPAAECTVAATDPRVSGTQTSRRVDQAGVSEGRENIVWGDTALEGPAGSWTGHWYVVRDSGGTNHWLTVLVGDEAYKGWTYVHASDASDDLLRPWSKADSAGLLYQGPPPAWIEPTREAVGQVPGGQEAEAADLPREATVITGDKNSCAGYGWGVLYSSTTGRIPCRERASDPRLHGVLVESIDDAQCSHDIVEGCLEAGGYLLKGPDGTWEGRLVRVIVGSERRDMRVAIGTGAYRGWTYVSHADGGGRIIGLAYQGPPPSPWGVR